MPGPARRQFRLRKRLDSPCTVNRQESVGPQLHRTRLHWYVTVRDNSHRYMPLVTPVFRTAPSPTGTKVVGGGAVEAVTTAVAKGGMAMTCACTNKRGRHHSVPTASAAGLPVSVVVCGGHCPSRIHLQRSCISRPPRQHPQLRGPQLQGGWRGHKGSRSRRDRHCEPLYTEEAETTEQSLIR